MIDCIQIGERWIGPEYPCFIIAEAGVNHNGQLDLAKRLVDLSADSKVDAIKFQTFVTENAESKWALKHSYYSGIEDNVDKRELSKSLELTSEDFAQLKNHAESKGLIFLSTACDTQALEILVDLKVDALKIGSSDTNNIPLLREVAKTKLPVLLSTGMSTLDEVKIAYNELCSHGCKQLIILQCTANYPIQPSEVNLKVMQTYAETFSCPVGLSDHTMGNWAAVAAVALGANVIEKHITISRKLPGVDHSSSSEAHEMRTLVEEIRNVEAALGSEVKSIQPVEQEHLLTMRKSLVAARDLPAGTIVSEEDVLVKRPGSGIPPTEIDQLIGKRLKIAVSYDDLIKWEMVE